MDVSINKGEIERMAREIQREFDKHPITVGVQAKGTPYAIAAGRETQIHLQHEPPAGQTTIYNGPVFLGSADGAQLAWNNQTANQAQNRTEQVSPGYEALAAAVVKTLEDLPAAGLNEDDLADANEVGQEILAEVVKPEPDQRKLKKAVAALKGYLSPLLVGAVAGAAAGAHQWAQTAIEQLGKHI